MLLVNHDTKGNSPIVVPVPPPSENGMEAGKLSEDVNMNVQPSASTAKIEMIKEETIEEKLQSIYIYTFSGENLAVFAKIRQN